MRFLTYQEEQLNTTLIQSRAECMELYDNLDRKYEQLANLVEENNKLETQLQETLNLLKEIKEEWEYCSDDVFFCDQYEKHYLKQTEEFLNKIKQ